MTSFTSPLFLLQAAQQSDPILGMLVPMVLIAGIFYFLIFRPMRKRQKQTDTMISSLQNGDKVITTGGVYGTIAGLKEKTVILKVADNIKIEVAKHAVAGLQSAPPEEK
jgi:preprotein translocase subunit YajC